MALRGDGEYFGEKALLTNETRMASCIAAGEVECARMDRDTFTRILGPLGEILKFREYDADGKEVAAGGEAAAGGEGGGGVAGEEANLHFEFADGAGQENVEMHRDLFDQGPTLGIGAFGYVQLVHYKETGKVYALKTLTKQSILKTDQFTHCRDEIANLRAATNPFIGEPNAWFRLRRKVVFGPKTECWGTVNLYSCFHDEVRRAFQPGL